MCSIIVSLFVIVELQLRAGGRGVSAAASSDLCEDVNLDRFTPVTKAFSSRCCMKVTAAVDLSFLFLVRCSMLIV